MKIVNYITDSTIECAPFSWGVTLFSFGCNLHCKMCEGYNYEIVTNESNIKNDAISLLESIITPMHDCVIFLGGEPTIWDNKLKEALRYCHNKGLKTKIFTNGVLSKVVREINEEKLCDAWSVDYKGIPENISREININAEDYKYNINKTINSIIDSKLPLEIRTTFYEGNINDKPLIEKICSDIVKKGKQINGSDYFIKWIEQHDIRKYYKN